MNHARRYFDYWGTTAILLFSLHLWVLVQFVGFGHGPYVATAVVWSSYIVLGSICVGVWRGDWLALVASQVLGWAMVLLDSVLWIRMDHADLARAAGLGIPIALHAAALLYGLAPRTRAAFVPAATS